MRKDQGGDRGQNCLVFLALRALALGGADMVKKDVVPGRVYPGTVIPLWGHDGKRSLSEEVDA
jgi:hypothetical protein